MRSNAVRALGVLGPAAKDATPAVRALMDDSADMRFAAKDALSRIEGNPARH